MTFRIQASAADSHASELPALGATLLAGNWVKQVGPGCHGHHRACGAVSQDSEDALEKSVSRSTSFER